MRHAITLVALATLTTACSTGQDFNLRSLTMPATIDASAVPETGIEASFSGDMPRVEAFDDDQALARVESWDDGRSLTVTLESFNQDGWKMTNVTLMDNGDGTMSFSPESSIGCTGREEGNADMFDDEPDDVDVDAELVEIDGEPMVELEIRTDYGRRGQTVGVVYVPVEG